MRTVLTSADDTNRRDLQHLQPGFLVAPEFAEALAGLGLTSADAVFAFDVARDLAKPGIGRFRRRLQFEATPAGATSPVKVFLKRYDRPPLLKQLSNWVLHHRRTSFAQAERQAADRLAAQGVPTPRVIALGEEWGILFEQRSFLASEEVKDAEALQRRLPDCFAGETTPAKLRARRDFIRQLAAFVRRFHDTGFRHRDLYLAHVFHAATGGFCLIDLARATRPLLQRRFQVKDIAQLHYSAPATHFSRTDRLRFFLAYSARRRLSPRDKVFLCRVTNKATKMARHSRKHGVSVPFLER